MQNKHKLMLAVGAVLLAAFCFIAVGTLNDSDSDGNVTLSAGNATPVASIGDTTYNTLEEALNTAVSGQTVVLISDYTMTSNATVKAGVFLLLPCMDNDVGYTSTGYNPDGTTTSVKSQYRTLTIDKNATLTIEGKVLINAVTGYPGGGDYDQDIRGGYAQINLSGNIIVKSGGILDNCGYIKGNGEVIAESGAEIRDLFVIESWRGGTHGLNLIGGRINVLLNKYGDPFPLNEYNCHNIESKITINSGASLLGNVKMYGGSTFNYTRYPQIDNNNGLIHLNDNAYLVKTYDAATDRVNIAIYGGASAEKSTLTFSFGGITKPMTSSKFTYPIDGDISFELHNGNYTFNNNFKFLTGATLTVFEDATLTVPENKKVVFYDVFKDVDNVGNTEYPDRPAAYILLKGNSTLNIQGSFGGIVKYETSADQIIIGPKAITQNVESKEANGYNNTTTPSITLYFNLQIQDLTA